MRELIKGIDDKTLVILLESNNRQIGKEHILILIAEELIRRTIFGNL